MTSSFASCNCYKINTVMFMFKLLSTQKVTASLCKHIVHLTYDSFNELLQMTIIKFKQF